MNVDRYKQVAAITIASVVILGAGGIYAVFEYQDRVTPAGVVLLLAIALQQISTMLLSKDTQVVKQEVDGKMERMKAETVEEVQKMVADEGIRADTKRADDRTEDKRIDDERRM